MTQTDVIDRINAAQRPGVRFNKELGRSYFTFADSISAICASAMNVTRVKL